MMFPSQQEAVFLFLFPNPHRCWPSQQLPSPQWSPELRTAVWILHPVQERPVPNSLHPLTHSLSPNTAFSPRLSPPSPHSHFPCELSSNFHLSPMLTDTGCAYGARMGKEQTFLSAFIRWTSEMTSLCHPFFPIPDNQAENRQQPLCQRISGLLQAHGHGEVMRIFCLLSLSR